MVPIPEFTAEGVLPVGDHPATLAELKQSVLVLGPKTVPIGWDRRWRAEHVEHLGMLVPKLWAVGIEEVFVDGSFVENKSRPGDIDGYFRCDIDDFLSGRLQSRLRAVDPSGVWTWAHEDRCLVEGEYLPKPPMWERYRVELYPHFPGLKSGIRDEFGEELELPAAFRQSRRQFIRKGIVRLVRDEVIR